MSKLALILICLVYTTPLLSAEKNNRTFMFIGEPNAAAWQYLMDNPEDRKAEVDIPVISRFNPRATEYVYG